MASAFGHALAALSFRNLIDIKYKLPLKIVLLGVVYSILPDADVITFKFGIPYESVWGHRGISHSLLFSLVLALITALFLSKNKIERIIFFVFLFISTLSHTILDAMTTGGKGVAFFAPFDNTRYFLPWRVIKVSPIGIKNFLSQWGLKVIQSELIWIGIPFIITLILYFILKKKNNAVI
ncbi:MAG: metal-dependent hydrolase [Bacteroidetes bacterium]|nr:metal-dependent hydrolase [Bacteroidota bacterium]MCB9227643.1 metal-dependent hydrolase [Chitinophagales bacterium]